MAVDDLEALAAAGRDAAVVVLASPNNPTGRVVIEGLEEFVAAVSTPRAGAPREAYREYAPPRVTGLDLFHAGHEVVVLRTLSKAWGLAGARVGYAVMDPALQAVARSAQDTFEVSAATFAAARASLDDADVIAGRMVEKPASATGWRRSSPRSASTAGRRPRTSCARAARSGRVRVERMAEQGILVRPTAVFGAPDRVRIGSRPSPRPIACRGHPSALA